MSELHLIRATMAYDTPSCYEEKTDVWVFGDVNGYRTFQDAIRQALAGKRAVRPVCSHTPSNSMRVTILPPSAVPRRQPRLKLVERIVFLRAQPEMELVIYGNGAGYTWLIECLERAATAFLNDPSDHLHLDDHQDHRVVRRSVALNIRGAVDPWSREALGGFASLVFDRQSTYVPGGIGNMTKKTCPYEDPKAGEFPFTLR